MAEERVETYPTAIGPVTLRSNWEAAHLAMQRRCGWGRTGPKAVAIEVRRVPKRADPLDKPAGLASQVQSSALKIMDADVLADASQIKAEVPEPSFCAGVILDWLWLALGSFCKPDGWEFLHAAAVADGDGVTLIVGPSGGGKTTALLALLDAGAQFVSDDAVLLDTQDGMVRPWTSDLHLLPEQMKRWPTLIGDTLDANGKVRISPQALGYPASEGGMLRRIVVLASKQDPIDLGHRGVGLEDNAPDWATVSARADVDYWGYRAPDLKERIAALYKVNCPSGAVCTPFSGKADYLDRWLEAFLALKVPTHAHLLWLCNAQNDAFWQQLQQAADVLRKTYPNLQVWKDSHRVGLKDKQVAYLWQQLRTRIPEGCEFVFTLEDDVLPDPGAFTALLAEWARREKDVIVGVPVAHIYQHGAVTALAWDYRASARGVQLAENVEVREAPRQSRPAEVGGISFSCCLIPREVFEHCTLAPGNDNYPASGYDHQFCREAAEADCNTIALWGTEATHLKADANPCEVRLLKRRVVVIGEGEDVPDGPTWEIVGRATASGGELSQLLGRNGAEFALFTDRQTRLPAAYIEACLEHFTWNPAAALVSGYRTGSDGKMTLGAGPGVCVRLAATRAAPQGSLEDLRLWLVAEGWKEAHQDRAPYHALGNGAPLYERPVDPRRERSPYRVLMLNRDPYQGEQPGFGGDLTQIAGYRAGLRALGIYADLRGPSFAEGDGYDLVHLHHVQFDWAKEAAAHDFGDRPVVCSTITHKPPGAELPRWFVDPVVSQASHLICYSRQEALWYAQQWPEKSIHVVPVGVSAELFPDPDWQEPAERTLLMCGKVCAYKNQRRVLEACERLGATIAFAGFNEDPTPDPYVDEFLAAVEAYPKATMLGFLHGEELWDAYRAAHLHVNASAFEPFGQVTVEALALGSNIVHSQHSWAAELFGKAGSLCDPDDVDSIAQAIETELGRRRGWANARPPTLVEAARSLAAVYEEALA